MKSLSVQPSPRLLFGARGIDDLPDRLHSNYLKAEAERVLADADWLVRARPIAEGEGDTYQHGTRAIASQIQCLTAAWALTRDGRYRRAAVRHLSNLMNWNHISCEARPDTPAKKELPFCLSYGEHAADIALLYDLIRPDITDEEQQVFFDVLDRFYLKEALKCLDNPPWWAFKQWSNWNGVCAGGIGLLALSFYTDRPEAKKLIPFVEKSLGEYFKSFIENDGGCHEGTGYWNYGLHYAMRYVLSWETATGDRHPALSIREFKKGLYFPLDFSGISFGDNDGWHPSAYYFRLTERLNEPDAALSAATWLPDQPKKREGRRNRLDRCANGNLLFAADQIPTDEQMKRLRKQHAKKRQPVARVYDGLDWAALADDSAFPQLRLAARGGSSEISGHGMVDLLSFRCRYNGALMITDQQDG
ncbi:MAG: hypothetical protein R3336_04800, partial [Phycisphaeraceae bacterium]|nr:hypothetical protein [Phycisphaeraceae bacterium]